MYCLKQREGKSPGWDPTRCGMNNFAEKMQNKVAASILGYYFSVESSAAVEECLLMVKIINEIINHLQLMKNSNSFDVNNHKDATWETLPWLQHKSLLLIVWNVTFMVTANKVVSS